MATSQTNKGKPKPDAPGCLSILLVLAGVILYTDIYSFLGRNDINAQVVTATSSVEPLDITVIRGQTLTFEMVYDADGSSYLATPDGIHLTIDSRGQPLLIVASSSEDWRSESSITITTHTYKEDTPMIAGTLTFPQSIGGPEQRVLQGRLQGTITQPCGVVA